VGIISEFEKSLIYQGFSSLFHWGITKSAVRPVVGTGRTAFQRILYIFVYIWWDLFLYHLTVYSVII